MQMLQDRNLTIHTCNEETAQKIVGNISPKLFSHVRPTAGDVGLSQG